MINPARVLTNSAAQAGDVLILTKALGTGVISTAIKKEKARASWIDAATASMTTLNSKAAELAASGRFAVHSATDITGFGLIGHAREMALGSGVRLRIRAAGVPFLDGALECARGGFIPGGLKANREFAECVVQYEGDLPDDVRALLFDPQTAGGLLLSVAQSDAPDLLAALGAADVPSAIIGDVLPGGKPLIVVQ